MLNLLWGVHGLLERRLCVIRVTGVLDGSICAVILRKPKSCAYCYIVTVAHSSNTCYVMLYNRGSTSGQATMTGAGACWSVTSAEG